MADSGGPVLDAALWALGNWVHIFGLTIWAGFLLIVVFYGGDVLLGFLQWWDDRRLRADVAALCGEPRPEPDPDRLSVADRDVLARAFPEPDILGTIWADGGGSRSGTVATAPVGGGSAGAPVGGVAAERVGPGVIRRG